MRALVALSAVGLAALALLAALVVMRVTVPIDAALARSLIGLVSPWLDALVNAHTVVGQAVTTTLMALALGAVVWRRGSRWSALAPLALLLATAAIELTLKAAFDHASPGAEFRRATGNPLGIRVATPSAFPSGHVARITYLAILVAALWPRALVACVAVAFVAFSAFARMYIGDHWLSDALGGIALGVAAGGAALAWLRARPGRYASK